MKPNPSGSRGLSALTRLFALLLAGVIGGCDQPEDTQKQELLVYCGITMVHPMREIANLVEQELGVSVLISQGGSEDLYQALKSSGQGDLYLPGAEPYRDKHLAEGLLGESVELGYNRAALVVPKGNPRGLSADLNQLADKNLAVALCNPESGSIGQETKRILDQAGITKAAFDNTALLTTDSRNLNIAIKNGDVDLILNWRATAFFPENRDHMDLIDLDPAVAEPKKLVLSQLTSSQLPEVAQRFMEIASSPQGQAIFRRYGFMDINGKSDDL